MIKKILSILFPYSFSSSGNTITKQAGFITTVAGALAVAGGAQAIGGIASAGAAERGADKATAAQREMFDIGRADLTPFREAGLSAIGRYQDLLRDPSKIRETPGYGFRLQEGLKGVAGVKGMQGKLFSGEAGKELTQYGQEYATSELDKALSREYNMVQVGANAAAGSATQAGYAGQSLANIEMQRGAAVGSAYGQIAQGLGGIGSAKGYAKFLEK